MTIRKHLLISGLMMTALVPYPVLAQNAANGSGANSGAPAAATNETGANAGGAAAGDRADSNAAGKTAAPNPAAAANPGGSSAGTNTSGNAAVAESASPGNLLVEPVQKLINRPLVDPDGHSAGRIDRIVLNTGNGAIDFVIIRGDDNFDLHGKVLALPWGAIASPTAATGAIKISIPAAKLQKAPLLNPGAIASLEDPTARAGVYGWYGYRYAPYGVGYGYGPYCCYGRGYGWAPGMLGRRYSNPGGRYDNYAGGNTGYGAYNRPNLNSPYPYPGGPGGGAGNNGFRNGAFGPNNGPGGGVGANGAAGNNFGPNAGQTAANNVAAGSETAAGREMVRHGLVIDASGVVKTLASPNTTSARALKASDVYAPNGHYIGGVQHVLLDPKHGEVAFALIKEGGFLGLAPHWFAIPVQALAWAPYHGGYRLTVTARVLANEPSIPVQTQLPSEVSEAQLAQLYQHFGLRPYWEGGGGQNGSGTANAGAGFAGNGNARHATER